MKVAVVGLGLFGMSLALELARAGAEVIAIDENMELCNDVKNEVAVAVRLDATDERELRAQGVHQVDVLVASIGNDFEANLLLILLAKEMGIPRVIARAPSKRHAKILLRIGADEVILPEIDAAAATAKSLLTSRKKP